MLRRRWFSGFAVCALTGAVGLLSLAGCGSNVKPSDKAFFPNPAPLLQGVAMITPPPAEGGAAHRGASLAGLNLLPAPEGETITLAAIDGAGAPLAGVGAVSTTVQRDGRFEFFLLPSRCVATPTTQPCVAGASPNLMLSMGQGANRQRALVMFQTDQVLDPVSEAVAAAVLGSGKGLVQFGPIVTGPLTEAVREETRNVPVLAGQTAQAVAAEVFSASASLRGAVK